MKITDLLRSVGAVLAGLAFIGITHTTTDAVLKGMGILPRDHLFVDEGLLLVVLGYRAAFSFVGCYLTAWLAPREPVKHALVLGLLGVLLGTAGAIANSAMDLGPTWFPWTLVAITIPIAWLGGKAYEARQLG